MSRFNSSSAGKGSDSRISDHNAYWSSPLWDNIKNKKYNTFSEFSDDFTPVVDEFSSMKFCFIDDDRMPQNAHIWDEDKTLQQVSGIPNDKWVIVRSYDEFVKYVEEQGIPDVISFDNDLWVSECKKLTDKQAHDSFQMINWENSPIKTGAHCAAWLCERCKESQHPLPKYYVHSANVYAWPVIKGIMETARPLIKH